MDAAAPEQGRDKGSKYKNSCLYPALAFVLVLFALPVNTCVDLYPIRNWERRKKPRATQCWALKEHGNVGVST